MIITAQLVIGDNRTLSVFLVVRSCTRVSVRFTAFPRVFAYLCLPSHISRARVCVHAMNVRGSLIVSRTSARTIDLSHARRQIAARRSPDFARRENILLRARERRMKKRDLPRAGAEIGRTRVYPQRSTPLISFLSVWSAPLSGSDVNGTNRD